MPPLFESGESTVALGLGAIALIPGDILWFSALLPMILPDVYAVLLEYFAFFAVWGLLGLSLVLAPRRKQQGLVFIVFLFAVVTAYAVGQRIPVVYTFTFAFVGAYNGAGLAIVGVLIKRHVLKTAQTPWVRSRAWATKKSRDAILTAAFSYPAAIVFALYFVNGQPSSLGYLAFGLIAVAMFFAVRPKKPVRRVHGK